MYVRSRRHINLKPLSRCLWELEAVLPRTCCGRCELGAVKNKEIAEGGSFEVLCGRCELGAVKTKEVAEGRSFEVLWTRCCEATLANYPL